MLLLVTALANAAAPVRVAAEPPQSGVEEPADVSVWDDVPEPEFADAASSTPPMPAVDPEVARAIEATAARARAREAAAQARAARRAPAPAPVAKAAPAPVAKAAPAPTAAPAPAALRPARVDRLARVAAEKGKDPLVVRTGYTATEAPVGERPQRGKQAPDPYSSVDFTAYTLEPGEFRVGLGSVSVGLYGRVQVGTSAVLDALRVANLNFKVDAVRAGPLDVAVYGAGYNFFGEELTARYGRIGVQSSLRVSRGFSVHGGAAWSGSYLNGTPNLDPLAPVFSVLAGWQPSADAIDATEGRLEVEGTGGFLSTRAAADVRFNRRDSIVLQAEAVVYGHSEYPVEIPASLTGGSPVAPNAEGPVAVTEAYVASVAWQASFRNVDLRIGIGTSSIPGAWLLQSTELAFRFGGPSRRSERLRMVAWRAHERDAVADDDDVPASRPASSGGLGSGGPSAVRPGVQGDARGGAR